MPLLNKSQGKDSPKWYTYCLLLCTHKDPNRGTARPLWKNLFFWVPTKHNELLTHTLKKLPKIQGEGKWQSRKGIRYGCRSRYYIHNDFWLVILSTRKYNKPAEHISADFSSPETAPPPFPPSRKASHLVFNSLMRGRRSRSIELSKFKLIAAIIRLL